MVKCWCRSWSDVYCLTIQLKNLLELQTRKKMSVPTVITNNSNNHKYISNLHHVINCHNFDDNNQLTEELKCHLHLQFGAHFISSADEISFDFPCIVIEIIYVQLRNRGVGRWRKSETPQHSIAVEYEAAFVLLHSSAFNFPAFSRL